MEHILITVAVTVELNGERPQDIRQHMQQSFARAIGNGALTGYTEAEVDNYELAVQSVPGWERANVEGAIGSLVSTLASDESEAQEPGSSPRA